MSLDEEPGVTHKLIYRDIAECADYLMKHPAFAGKMVYTPEEVRESDGKTRVYNEVFTGDAWHRIQVSHT